MDIRGNISHFSWSCRYGSQVSDNFSRLFVAIPTPSCFLELSKKLAAKTFSCLYKIFFFHLILEQGSLAVASCI